MGQPEKALNSYKLYKNYNDSLFNEKNSSLISELQTKYETAELERVIAQLKREKEKKEYQLARSLHMRAILIILTVSIVIILIILYIMYQMKIRANKKLEKFARFDYLTRVYNKRAIQENLDYHVNYFERSKTPFVIMIIDVDNLKYINDHYGHPAGDYVLQKLTTSISNTIRKLDIIGRWGGDEFIVILPFTKLAGARVLGEKLREVVGEEKFIYNGKTIQVSIIIGLAEYNDKESMQNVINKADQALLIGKKMVRTQWSPKKLILIVPLIPLIFIPEVKAQSNVIDSFRENLDKAPAEKQSEILYSLPEEYENIDRGRAIMYAVHTSRLAQQCKQEELVLKCKKKLGGLYYFENEYDLSVQRRYH
ncbi:MAG TPA: GGDEF domain-containing protein [Candidatus Cloacimonetes bacterium]|nr:GGDEF domain-containing protein [Candidatus Cloacimonadota bacterium]HEX37532.1 GGDEF domain-containing protein [Candidatus Cloacimonadota bacterium]